MLFEENLQDLLLKNDVCKKEFLITEGFNINLLDYENNKKVQSFVNLMFRCGMVPAISKRLFIKPGLQERGTECG